MGRYQQPMERLLERLIGVILLIGALSFLPAMALGPIAEYFMH
ncbi:potassium-transporting ATPase subunit KdpA [Carnobacterium maltaromaticum]